MDFLFVYISNFLRDIWEKMWISRDRNADVCFQFYVLTNTRNFFSKLTEEFGTDAATQILSGEIIIGKYPVILYYN